MKEFRSHWHSPSGRTTTDILVRKTRTGARFMSQATCGRAVTRAYGNTPLSAFNRECVQRIARRIVMPPPVQSTFP